MRALTFSVAIAALCAATTACGTDGKDQPPPPTAGGERHLSNIRQLTHGGENAEAYFSTDGTRLIFQSTREGVPCDQIVVRGGVASCQGARFGGGRGTATGRPQVEGSGRCVGSNL